MTHPIDNAEEFDPPAGVPKPAGTAHIPAGVPADTIAAFARASDVQATLTAAAEAVGRLLGAGPIMACASSEAASETVWLPDSASGSPFAALALAVAATAAAADRAIVYAAGDRIKVGKSPSRPVTLPRKLATIALAGGAYRGAVVFEPEPGRDIDREMLDAVAGLARLSFETLTLQEMLGHEQAERLRLEEELRISDERLRTAVQAAGIGTWHWDLRTGAIEWSDSAYAIMDIPPGEAVSYESFLTHVHPGDRKRVEEALQSALQRLGSYEIEHRVLLADGSDRWVFSKGEVSLDSARNARRFEGVIQDIDGRRRLAQIQRFLVELSDTTRGVLDPDEVLWTAVSALGEHLAIDRCMYGEVRGEEVHAHRNYTTNGTHDISGVFPVDAFGVAEQLRAGKTVIVDDIRTHPLTSGYRPIYEEIGVRAHVTVPLLKEGEWVGVLTAHMAQYPRHWREHEVELMQAVAERTWLALENARLYRATREEVTVRRRTERELANVVEELKGRYAHEHRIAATLQRSLLQMPPEQGFPGARIWTEYVPALDDADVGGDFLDAFPVGDGKVALVIGDVSGKGLVAAARTAEIKYTLRGFLREYDAPAVAMTRLNNVLSDAVEPDAQTGFVCLSIIVFDPRSGRTACSIAGAEAPMVVRESGVIQSMAITGPPLTVVPRFEYDVCQTDLAVGDVLLMVTDGITEARSGRLFFGYEGLARAAAAMRGKDLHAIGAAIVREATEFAGGRLRDDACLLLAQRTDDDAL